VIRGYRVGDRHPDVGPVQGEPRVAERVHQRDHVPGQGARVVSARRLVGQADAALVDRDDLEVPRQRRHQHAPGVPGLGPAVNEQQRRAVTADDCVQANVTRVDVPAGERFGESRRQVRRPGDGSGPFRDGQTGGS
jgi:hypothetical protein